MRFPAARQNKRRSNFKRRNLIATLLSLVIVCSLILLVDYQNTPDKYNEWFSTDAAESTEETAAGLKEEAWDKQLEAYLADGKKDLALELLQQQIAAQGASAQLYGWAAERFSQHRYPAEAAAIWLEGIMETGAPELAEQLRQAVAPADMIESGSLKRFLKTAYGKPAEQITWEDLYQLKSLSISDEEFPSSWRRGTSIIRAMPMIPDCYPSPCGPNLQSGLGQQESLLYSGDCARCNGTSPRNSWMSGCF